VDKFNPGLLPTDEVCSGIIILSALALFIGTLKHRLSEKRFLGVLKRAGSHHEDIEKGVEDLTRTEGAVLFSVLEELGLKLLKGPSIPQRVSGLLETK